MAENSQDENIDLNTIWNFKPELSIKPGDDFYSYVNSNWLKDNPERADYSRYGSFEVLNIQFLYGYGKEK